MARTRLNDVSPALPARSATATNTRFSTARTGTKCSASTGTLLDQFTGTAITSAPASASDRQTSGKRKS